MKAEEALREFAEKWGYKPDTYKYKDEFGKDTGVTIAMCTYTEEKDELLSDLTALISEHYYPKEFVTWLSFGPHPFVYWFDEEGQYYTDEITDKRWDIEDLYNHWKENER